MEARRGSLVVAICLDGVRPAIAGADADRLLYGNHEDLAIADAPGPRRHFDCLDHAIHLVVLDYRLDLHLRQEVDDIFRAAIELGMTFLAAETLDLGDGYAADARVVKRVLHIIQLEGFDDRLDLFHGPTLSR
jgi:hypothetical protein